jgi:hypothetical protein
MRRRRPTDEEIIEDIINRMFEIAGYSISYEDIINRNDNWYQQYTMTEEQDKAWRDWVTNYLKKECKHPTKIAERSASMYSLMWGLKIRNDE